MKMKVVALLLILICLQQGAASAVVNDEDDVDYNFWEHWNERRLPKSTSKKPRKQMQQQEKNRMARTRLLELTSSSLQQQDQRQGPLWQQERKQKQTRKASRSSRLRHLDQDFEYEHDLDFLSYLQDKSINYEGCDVVETTIASSSSTSSILSQLASFSMCPTDTSCESPSPGSCQTFTLDLETYLSITTEYFYREREEYCQLCYESCGPIEIGGDDFYGGEDDGGHDPYYPRLSRDGNDDGVGIDESGVSPTARNSTSADCDTCSSECLNDEIMEDVGYIDAVNFIHCKMIKDEDEESSALYAGPRCFPGGKIRFGVFLDEDCTTLDPTKDLEFILGVKLAHFVFKKSYESVQRCITAYLLEENHDNIMSDLGFHPLCLGLCGEAQCQEEQPSEDDDHEHDHDEEDDNDWSGEDDEFDHDHDHHHDEDDNRIGEDDGMTNPQDIW